MCWVCWSISTCKVGYAEHILNLAKVNNYNYIFEIKITLLLPGNDSIWPSHQVIVNIYSTLIRLYARLLSKIVRKRQATRSRTPIRWRRGGWKGWEEGRQGRRKECQHTQLLQWRSPPCIACLISDCFAALAGLMLRLYARECIASCLLL